MLQTIKDAFHRYLKRLEKENRELFGNGKPDCCKLNHQQLPNSDNNQTKK